MSDEAAPETVPVPRSLMPHLSETAILLDIDGTLLDLAPTPREVWVPPGLAKTLEPPASANQRRAGAGQRPLAQRHRSDFRARAVSGRRRPWRGDAASIADSESVATHAPPMDKELKRRLAAIAKLSPGILLEDKGYSLALHYRLAPHAEKAIYAAVSLIRADLPNAPIEVLPGKCVCEIKHSGFTKATGVLRIDDARTVQGPPSALHRRRRHRRIGVCDHAGSSTASHFRSAGAPRAWPGISMSRAMSGNGSRICSMTKGTRANCHRLAVVANSPAFRPTDSRAIDYATGFSRSKFIFARVPA